MRKENVKRHRQIEDRGDQQSPPPPQKKKKKKKKTTPISHMLQAQLVFALQLFSLLLLFHHRIMQMQMRRWQLFRL